MGPCCDRARRNGIHCTFCCPCWKCIEDRRQNQMISLLFLLCVLGYLLARQGLI